MNPALPKRRITPKSTKKSGWMIMKINTKIKKKGRAG